MFSRRTFLSVSNIILLFIVQTGCTKKIPDSPYTINWMSKERGKGLDPQLADDLYAGRATGLVYEGLLQYHYLKRPYVLIPALADGMPDISQDGLTYTFKIKKGVLFQDDPSFKSTQGKGRELVAEDFVYSFKRLADPKLRAGSWWIFDGRIAGLNDWRDLADKKGQADYKLSVEGLKAVDRYTLQIRLVKRLSQFSYFLAMPAAFVVPREAVEHYGLEFQNHAVGTGPFRLVNFQGSSKIVYVKNPTFRKEYYPSEGAPGDEAKGLLKDAGKELPLAEKFVLNIVVEEQPRWLNFLAGKFDQVELPKDVYGKAITPNKEIAPDLKAKGISLVLVPQLEVVRDSFNMEDPVLGKNKTLRQAISLAIDSEKMGQLFFGGMVELAQGIIPPGLNGNDPAYKNPLRQYNISKAKELLAKAGYPGGKGLAPIDYLSLSDSNSRQKSEFMQKSLSEIGVQLNVSSLTWPDFQEKIKNKKGQMWQWGWGADYPDAENFLQMFYSKNISPGPNDANYINPEFDKFYEQALNLMDGPQRTQLYKKMLMIMNEDVPYVPHYHRLLAATIQPWLKNYKFVEFDHAMFKYYGIDPALKNVK